MASCRCSECYNSVTSQRNLDILKLDNKAEVKSYNLNGETLEIQCKLKLTSLFIRLCCLVVTMLLQIFHKVDK